MNGIKISRISWIETLFLKNSPNEHFSQLTNFVTVVLCSLLLILSAKIKVDLYPVPMTLQPLAVLMIAMLCGRNISVAAVSLYLFQGMVGIPVFAYGGGLPYLLGTDIGPLIDIEAKKRILKHLDRFKEKILFNSELDKNLEGFFVQPTIIEINDLKEIDEEVFGPILHIVRYSSDKMDNLVNEINNLNYGLTLGIHSRIDSTINFISNNVNVGNIYINRNITGAVVGSQPFGGRGLSGTGPKAGGPNYLLNLLNEKTLSNDITASGGNTSLLMLSDEND